MVWKICNEREDSGIICRLSCTGRFSNHFKPRVVSLLEEVNFHSATGSELEELENDDVYIDMGEETGDDFV